jgi:DMSO reductase anchor subunit
MWRTSWLSREVIVLPLFIASCEFYAAARFLGWPGAEWIGAVGFLACVALFICTAMIYICLRFLQEWASLLTLSNFVLLGAASGCTLAVPIAHGLAPGVSGAMAMVAMVLIVAALVSRLASLSRNARLKPRSTLQSATGLSGHPLRQISRGATGRSFNMREFLHGATPQKMRLVKWTFLVLVFPVPLVMLGVGTSLHDRVWLTLAFPLQYLGLIAERWYFFAQARHPQNVYYQAIA